MAAPYGIPQPNIGGYPNPFGGSNLTEEQLRNLREGVQQLQPAAPTGGVPSPLPQGFNPSSFEAGLATTPFKSDIPTYGAHAGTPDIDIPSLMGKMNAGMPSYAQGYGAAGAPGPTGQEGSLADPRPMLTRDPGVMPPHQAWAPDAPFIPAAGQGWGVSHILGNEGDAMRLAGAIKGEHAQQDAAMKAYETMMQSRTSGYNADQHVAAEQMRQLAESTRAATGEKAAMERATAGHASSKEIADAHIKAQKEIANMGNERDDRKMEESEKKSALDWAAKLKAKDPVGGEREANAYLEGLGRDQQGNKLSAKATPAIAAPGATPASLAQRVAQDFNKAKGGDEKNPGASPLTIEKLLPMMDSAHYQTPEGRAELAKQLRQEPGFQDLNKKASESLAERLNRLTIKRGFWQNEEVPAEAGGYRMEPPRGGAMNVTGPNGYNFSSKSSGPLGFTLPLTTRGYNRDEHQLSAERLAKIISSLRESEPK